MLPFLILAPSSQADLPPAPHLVSARLRKIGESAARYLAGRRIVRLVQIPASNRWVALISKPAGPGYLTIPSQNETGFDDLRLMTVHGNRVVNVGPPKPLYREPLDDWFPRNYSDGHFSVLKVIRLAPNARTWSVVVTRNYLNHRAPSLLEIYVPGRRRLKRSVVITSYTRLRIEWPSARQGLTVSVRPDRNVWFEDTYEWRHGHFALANWAHPELYDPKSLYPASDDRAIDWMTWAATYDIRKSYSKAFRCWRRALEILRAGGGVSKMGFWDEDKNPIPELKADLRLRMRWLRNRDYSHPLLYRLHRRDIEVPPYHL